MSPSESAPPTQPNGLPGKPIDCHVHLVGTGAGGTGCWLRLSAWRRPMAVWMLRHVGLPRSALHGDLDRLYVERLLELVRTSSLGSVVLLAQDLVRDEQGEPLDGASPFYVPNERVLALAQQHPEFLAGVSIHPARPDALEELERCLAGGAALMKCLPNCHNINCNDRRFTPFWERMAATGLPLLAHTGGEHTLPVVERAFSDPRILALPLECGVKVIAAHCATKSGLSDPEYFHIFQGMTRRFSNLYGDNSAFTVPIRGRHVRECIEPPLVERIVHGSDLPVPVYGHFPWLRGYLDWSAFRRCQAIQNVLERDYQIKRAMGFPEATFTRLWSILRPTARPVHSARS
ncbi:MAG TPA: amidohydrolase family protein [Verrucomicrobiae bacterium]|nr:amidohydrolase family protein [Verrucomicrobiae bacterium]